MSLGHMFPNFGLPFGDVVSRVFVGLAKTYSAQGISQADVISIYPNQYSMQRVLTMSAPFAADGHRMSMVFARNMGHIRDSQLQQRFSLWLEQATAPTQQRHGVGVRASRAPVPITSSLSARSATMAIG